MDKTLILMLISLQIVATHTLTWTFSCSNKPNGNYRDPSDCSKFYICSNNHAFSMNCVAGLHFHAPSGNCVWSEEANCIPNPCEEQPNGNYKDPQNCDKYISCVWGITYSMNCYPGLFYDANRDECVYPYEVECQ